ncbi:MAG TPA: hypothetical protein VM686_42635 [Polyangiaceae bacterium]|nr:hypothetical protein [Polyangiaceae bacterium]
MPGRIESNSSSDYGLNYTPDEGDEAVCKAPEPAVDEEALSTDEGATSSGVDTLTRLNGKAQQGHLYEAAQANGGSEGGGSGAEYVTPETKLPPGGRVYSVEGNVGAGAGTVGVQGSIVFDDKCGPLLVLSLNGGGQTPGVGANATVGIAGYEGSFADYNDALQVAGGVGAGAYGEGRVFVDPKTGEPIGAGVAVGVSTPGAGASVTRSESIVFPPCPRY